MNSHLFHQHLLEQISLHSTNETDLVELLTESIAIKDTIPGSEMNTCLPIDGSSLIPAVGKPEIFVILLIPFY